MIVCIELLATTFLLSISKIEQVEATRNDIMPVEPLIEYMKKRVDKISQYEPMYTDKEVKAEVPEETVEHYNKKKTMKHKKQKNTKLKKAKKLHIMKKKPYKLAKKNSKKEKNMWIQESNKDSRMSESRENSSGKGNPVDIIVHIKMNK